MRYELKSIPLWPVTRVAFFVNLVVGFVMGLLLAIFLMPMVAMMASVAAYDASELDFDSGAMSALTMMIPFLMALWSAFFNTIFVVIIILGYNLVARVAGGIELRLDLIELPSLSPELAPRPEPPAAEPVIASPPSPATARPEPPPPVITQPEPRLPDTASPAPAEEPRDTDEPDDKNINE